MRSLERVERLVEGGNRGRRTRRREPSFQNEGGLCCSVIETVDWQPKYIASLLHDFGMEKAKAIDEFVLF